MPTRAINFTPLNGLTNDIVSELHNFAADTFSVRLVTEVVTAATATNATLTEVTGANYTAGGIVQTTSVTGTEPNLVLESSTTNLWSENASGFTNAASAVVYNDTSGRILTFADIRDGVTPVSSAAKDVQVNFENGTDILSLGVA